MMSHATPQFGLDAKSKLQRYCYLGNTEPVYTYTNLRAPIDAEQYAPRIIALCRDVEKYEFLMLLQEVFHDRRHVRREESIFVFAVYLSSNVPIKVKTEIRQYFPFFLTTSDDLFLFCKYSVAIRGQQHRTAGFSSTIRKAIISWYEHRTFDEIKTLWLTERGGHGFTHKLLIKLCHINDESMGSSSVAHAFFRSCTQLMKESEKGIAPIEMECQLVEMLSSSGDTPVTTPSDSESDDAQCVEQSATSSDSSKDNVEKTYSTTEISPSIFISMSKLRTTEDADEALKIIRRFQLSCNQVPAQFLRHSCIIEALIPNMSYRQLFMFWPTLVRYNHLANDQIFSLCRVTLDNMQKLQESDIHPINFLIQMSQLGIGPNLARVPTHKLTARRVFYFKQLYGKSFGKDESQGLRLHITVNLQDSYRRKHLKNFKGLSYYEAAVAIAFGYYKRELNAEVFHWSEDNVKLEQIPWRGDMSIGDAIKCCDSIKNPRNSQKLILPILHAFSRQQVYDMFLVIVPAATRGNPQQRSDYLRKHLDKYRQLYNMKARYVIVDLMRYKKSMTYSETCQENILEICGLDEHTTNLIHNYALGRFF